MSTIQGKLDTTLMDTTTTAVDLSLLVTIVVVTSPIESNPSTELLDRCLSSIIRTWPELSTCRIVIAADGCEEEEDDGDELNDDDDNTCEATTVIHTQSSSSSPSSSYTNAKQIKKKRRKRVFGKASTKTLQDYYSFLDRLESRKWLIVDRPAHKISIQKRIHNDNDKDNIDKIKWTESLSTEWLGFTLTLKKAMDNHVTTPIVFVTPHDYELESEALKDIHAERLVNAILSSTQKQSISISQIDDNNKNNDENTNRLKRHPINYIGLHNAKTLSLNQRNAIVLKDLPCITLTPNNDYTIQQQRKEDYTNLDNHQSDYDHSSSYYNLTPLASWKENPHFASVSAYHSVVFNSKHHRFKRGHFIEDTLGQKMLQALKDAASHNDIRVKQEIFESFGTFLIDTTTTCTTTTATIMTQRKATETSTKIANNNNDTTRAPPHTYHINGLKYIDTQKRVLRGFAPPREFEMERAQAARDFVRGMDDMS